MPTVVCPSCQRKMRVPENLAGRQLICPGCNDAVEPPEPEPEPDYLRAVEHFPQSGAALPSTEGAQLSPPARLGALSMILGTLSVMVLCLPYVGYAALVFSGVGLLIGLGGLVSAFLHGAPRGAFRQPDGGYPLAGVGICLLALTLTLLPFLFS
jgi:hypothetical protein